MKDVFTIIEKEGWDKAVWRKVGAAFENRDGSLTLFLDAPAEVLHARKPEWTLEHLERQRKGIMEQGRSSRNFVRIDATQPLDSVLADVTRYIAEYCENGST